MNLYTISLRFEDGSHDARELTRTVENLPGDVEIIAGRNMDVVTVQMSETGVAAAEKIDFAEVERFSKMNLL